MDDSYRAPTLLLLSLLVAVFAALYARSRTQRRLLWLIGWTMVTIRLLVLVAGSADRGIGKALAQSCMIIAASMFLGALSPVSFGARIHISYAVPFAVPIVAFAVSTSLIPEPGPALHLFNLLALLAAIAIAFYWGRRRILLPLWFNRTWPIVIGAPCLILAASNHNELALRLAHSGVSLATALLVLAVYRRLSPGAVFTASGFLLWSSLIFLELWASPNEQIWTVALQLLNLTKVMTAVGMIVLVSEDEARQNETAQRRDRHARSEMERYAALDLAIEPQRDFGIQYSQVCNAIVEASRFRQAALYLLDVERKLGLSAGSGWNPALTAALERLGSRLSVAELRRCWTNIKSEARRTGCVASTNLQPCLSPADEPALQDLTGVYTLPITARSGDLQGILLLADMKDPKEPLLPEDLLPLQLLVARVAAARENGILTRSITRSEKLAGIGRLAGGVAHELNNPLTVVMGYAELIQESAGDDQVRRKAEIIRSESMRMKQIIESLGRFWKPSPTPVLPIAVTEILTEVQAMRRSAFDRSGIRFDVILPPALPHIIANDEQLRQVLLQLLDTAASSASAPDAHPQRRVRIEATHAARQVKIVISHSGPRFADPDKVFDPFFILKPPGEAPPLALSLCYSVVREQGGDLSALNLDPHGAAIVLSFPLSPPQKSPSPQVKIRHSLEAP